MPRGSKLRSRSAIPSRPQVYITTKSGLGQRTRIHKRRTSHGSSPHLDTDERRDECVRESEISSPGPEAVDTEGLGDTPGRQQTPIPSPPVDHSSNTRHVPATKKEDDDTQHHDRQAVSVARNIDKVNFGQWQIKTWYFSPYPLTESEAEDASGNSGVAMSAHSQRIPEIHRATARPHSRPSDLLTGGSGRTHTLPILWVCDRCFKYMVDGVSWELHVKTCNRRHPPGRKVYQRGAHTIWEVDGAKEKLYCQNLSLFGKLFIDVKTLFFDCDNFLFYLMTDAEPQRDHVLGYFSKEKISYDDYNLACIITLPPYQRKRYGMLMIEFSYELSRRAGKVGTPERPLSDLGLRSYLTYWISTLVRFFRRLLSVMPADISRISSLDKMPDLRSPSREFDDGVQKSKKKRFKGWDGETVDRNLGSTPMDDHLVSSFREIETSSNPDGSATSHVIVRCTLADIARATNLRPEDAAFALNECGLLSRRQSEGDNCQDVIMISREIVEAVAKERRVKDMVIYFMSFSESTTTTPRRLVVLISGAGTNLQALIDAQNTSSLPDTRIVLVLSNRKAAYGLTRAANAVPPIPTACLALQPFLKNNPGKTRYDYDVEISKIVLRENPDVVVLAGWMHILGNGFLEAMTVDTSTDDMTSRRSQITIINLHPALPGAFDGSNAMRRAYDAFQRGEITKSGVMVHRVVLEVDRGEPVVVREVKMVQGESFEAFEARMHEAEWQVIVEATAKVLDEVAPLPSGEHS